MNIFEQASRLKLRFQNPRGGELTVENLWDLPLKSETRPNLNRIAIEVSNEISKESTLDFVDGGESKVSKENSLKLEILKYIIETKKAENLEKQNKESVLSELRMLKEIRETRKLESIKNQSDEDLDKRIAELSKI